LRTNGETEQLTFLTRVPAISLPIPGGHHPYAPQFEPSSLLKRDFSQTQPKAMKNKLHFLITSERGRTHSFSLCRKKLRTTLVLAGGVALCLLVLIPASILYRQQNETLRQTVTRLQDDLQNMASKSQNFLATAKARQRQSLTREQQKEAQLTEAIADLHQKSRAIEAIFSGLGVDVQIQDSPKSSGGPFSALDDSSYENLSFKIDHYLALLRPLPLGSPVPGPIVSPFGRRIDPINNRPAFHDGVDIRNDPGSAIIAPADGVVEETGYSPTNGNFLILKHLQGLETSYLHLEKALVKRGEKVVRGETIGLLGNTGRSTGPHLHYSIHQRGQALDPLRFMRVAKYLKKGE
jgi:murein DD-endopeptidase MepM/ murein hydrolase activator NlpD